MQFENSHATKEFRIYLFKNRFQVHFFLNFEVVTRHKKFVFVLSGKCYACHSHSIYLPKTLNVELLNGPRYRHFNNVHISFLFSLYLRTAHTSYSSIVFYTCPSCYINLFTYLLYSSFITS